MTSSASVSRARPGTDPWRIAAAAVIVTGLSSGPYVSLSRWVARVPLGPDTWPFVYTYWIAGALGVGLFTLDVVGPVSARPLGHSRPLLEQLAAPLALAVWTLCSAFWTDSPNRTPLQALLMVFVVLAAVWFGFALTFREQAVSLFLGLQSMTLLSVPLAVGFTSGRFPDDNSWVGMFNNPNSLGPVAGLGIVAAGGVWLFTYRSWLRTIIAVCVVVDLVVVVKASSATASLALGAAVAALAVLALVRWLYARGMPMARVRGVGAVVAGGVAVALPWLFRVVADLFGKDSTLTGRTVIWDFVVDSVRHRWFAGYGFLSFWDDPVHRAALGERRAFTTIPDAAHSTFLETLLFLGVVGLVLLLIVVAMSVGRTWWAALSGRSWAMTWWAAVATFALFENLTESMIAYHSIFWLLLVAAGFAAVRDSMATDGR